MLGHTKEIDESREVVSIQIEPGSRTSKLIREGKEYGELFCTRSAEQLSEKATMIGEECDLLGLASPYTYIVKKRTLMYTVPVESFFKELLNLNPMGLKELKLAAAQKLK